MEDDTGGILRTEPNTFIEKTLITLEDDTGVLLREDAEETTEKFIRSFPQGRKPARTWLDTVEFRPGRRISETEFGPPRIVPTGQFLSDQAWDDTFGVYIRALTHKVLLVHRKNFHDKSRMLKIHCQIFSHTALLFYRQKIDEKVVLLFDLQMGDCS